ncbi:Uncharacterised protein [uncultured archaeon]|nr:Uncharacterised protein [uncultured archaeon]
MHAGSIFQILQQVFKSVALNLFSFKCASGFQNLCDGDYALWGSLLASESSRQLTARAEMKPRRRPCRQTEKLFMMYDDQKIKLKIVYINILSKSSILSIYLLNSLLNPSDLLSNKKDIDLENSKTLKANEFKSSPIFESASNG